MSEAIAPPTTQDSTREWARILEANPQIDRGTLERSRQVERQLAAVGIKLGGYRLEPALGGTATKPSEQPLVRRANAGMKLGETTSFAGTLRHSRQGA